MSLVEGFMIPKERRRWLYERLRRPLPDSVFGLSMQGRRVLIAQDKVSEMARGNLILKPQQAVERQQREAGSGWIVAVGPLVGSPCPGAPAGAVECEHPADLIGAHVYYRMWSGSTGMILRVDDEDDEFTSSKLHITIMTDRDLQAVDQGPDTIELTDEEKAAIDKAAEEQGL